TWNWPFRWAWLASAAVAAATAIVTVASLSRNWCSRWPPSRYVHLAQQTQVPPLCYSAWRNPKSPHGSSLLRRVILSGAYSGTIREELRQWYGPTVLKLAQPPWQLMALKRVHRRLSWKKIGLMP